MFEKNEKNLKLQIYKLKGLKRVNILIAEHKADCLKELKRQRDEYLKRLKSCRVSGLKEFKKAKKGWKGWKAVE